MERRIVGKNPGSKIPAGIVPSIILENPKYSHNVGAILRACSCFDIKQLWFTGNRVSLDDQNKRLPREERMRGYKEVDLYQFNYPFDVLKDAVPVAIEITKNSESLFTFEHPENAVYVFGPEDGSISQVFKRHCQRFVSIPTKHCTNLSAAVYITLYDRMLKKVWNGEEIPININDVLCENRGYDFEEF